MKTAVYDRAITKRLERMDKGIIREIAQETGLTVLKIRNILFGKKGRIGWPLPKG